MDQTIKSQFIILKKTLDSDSVSNYQQKFAITKRIFFERPRFTGFQRIFKEESDWTPPPLSIYQNSSSQSHQLLETAFQTYDSLKYFLGVEFFFHQ